ncbi:MAG TPA: Asp-tRNA(Asn)/Glu-tRNA(Gln) amidotransferase subunit GatB [Desulfobacteria bacterium]|nr:Asp-tRNA(Asn)/Glu-tRNA(Gln) amidotransferase subunit GatB [Desulfobacteria bacterium]
MEYDAIICFETHVELKTETKLFCSCRVAYDIPPNTEICPVCTGQPGALPVLNKKAVEYAIRAGVALDCTINQRSRFARKNYFYPDLPKGYQISQYELPFCENGYLEITGDDGKPYPVGIKRIHLEEDAGKLVHSSDSFDDADYSLVDYNRSSVPLLEIVGDHERNPLRSIQEARSYLDKLRQILRYIGISDCKMEKGQLRCDVNLSIRPKGSREFSNRTEVKNMSSFRFMMEALEYEMNRQAEILDSGGTVEQETLLFDEIQRVTHPMRSKENAPDYRYFPDPDLLEVNLEDRFITDIKNALPELPHQRVKRIMDTYGIPRDDALILTKDRDISDYFAACVPHCEDPKKLSQWIIKELFRLLNDASSAITECTIEPVNCAELVNLVSQGKVTAGIGRDILDDMFKTGEDPKTIIDKKGLKPIQDEDQLETLLKEVMDENPKVVSQISRENLKPIDFLVGQVMRKSKGKANPKSVIKLIHRKLKV